MQLGNLNLTKGSAKICVPITSETQDDILKEVREIKETHADLIEWRCDFYENCKDVLKVVETLKKIKSIVMDMPIIFTFRTTNEGGNTFLSTAEYLLLYKTVMLSKQVDAVDVELFGGDDIIETIRVHANIMGCKVVVSNHDFEATPPTEKIIARMKLMEDKGADIAKVAYMPRCETDVESVVNALRSFQEDKLSVIGISMGELGKVTRMKAGMLGSCITFASGKKASAPGQIYVEDLFRFRS